MQAEDPNELIKRVTAAALKQLQDIAMKKLASILRQAEPHLRVNKLICLS